MQTSWQKLVDTIEAFADDHLQIARFKSDFFEQFGQFAEEEEEFPVMYLVPPSTVFDMNTGTYTPEIYVLDRITEGRENITTIVSDSHLILNDLVKYIKNQYEGEVDIIGTASGNSVNNSQLDGYAGGSISPIFEVDSIGDCQIPLKSNI